jgi:S-DNA-T family DNA segregation ATPase FtsK/SpoIIIE
LRLQDRRNLSVALLAAGLVALLLLVPDLFGTAAPPLRIALGWGAFVTCAALIAGGLGVCLAPWLHRHSALGSWRVSWKAVVLAELLLLFLLVLTHLVTDPSLEAALAGRGGGLVGWAGGALLTGTVQRGGALGIALAGILATSWFLTRALATDPAGGLGAGIGPAAARLAEGMRTRAGRVSQISPNEALAALLAWCTGVLRGLLPSRADRAGVEGRQTSTRGRRAASSGEPSHAAAPSTPGPVEPGGSDAGRALPLKQAAGKARSPRTRTAAARGSKLRPDTLPPLEILRSDQGVPGGNPDVRLRAQTLKQTLADFGVPVEIVSIKEGPTVTQFGLEPGEVVRDLRDGRVQRRRVSVHSIVRLGSDLALALAAPSIRIEAPVPGRSYVGVEVPNTAKSLVSLRSVLESNEFARMASPLAAALGRDVSGDPVVLDLAALPHLLIAGATGSGKSVCINAIVCSLLMSNDPAVVRLIMVDPKMVELPAYNGVPHLFGPVITQPDQVPVALAWLTLQMDERYRIFSDNGVRNIAAYNRKAAKSRRMDPLPYVILVIDELADLMMATGFDIERQICRLAQLSRATGIHLVLATQRPSVDVITGLIKANFPARIAFAVTTQVDSRVILDAPGAEKLLGRGDMLYMAPDSAKLARIQGCFVADREIDAIVDFWSAAAADADMSSLASAPWADLPDLVTDRDELLEQALQLAHTKTHISTSLLQRQLRIGFPRAARLMEQLEEMGVVGPDDGGGRGRRVLKQQAKMVDRSE